MRRRKYKSKKGKRRTPKYQSFKYGKAQKIRKYGVSRGGIRL